MKMRPTKMSPTSLAIRRWRQFLANRGPLETVRTLSHGISRRLFHRFSSSPDPAQAAGELWRNADAAPMAIHPFDLRYGTDTSGLIWGEHLSTGHAHDAWNTAYYGIAPSAFNQALQRLLNQSDNRKALDPVRFTFIDLGSGKGRAVLLAAMYPFARALGVELSPALHAISIRNQASLPQDALVCRKVDFLLADASDFPWSDQLQQAAAAPLQGPLLFFLYNPFSRPVLDRFLRQMEAFLRTNPADTRFLCINPELDAVLTRHPDIEKLWQDTLTIAPDDQQADRFGSTTETVAAYRWKI